MKRPLPITGPVRTKEPDVQIDQKISFGEGLSSAFNLENTLVSGSAAFGVRGDRINARSRVTDDGIFNDGPDPDFDPFAAIEDTHYADYSKSFIGVHNRSEFRVVASKIDQELEDRRILESMGAKGIAASILAGTADPINLIPVGGAAVRSTKAGETILKTAGSVAVAGGAGAALAEGVLQPTQETRTAEDAQLAILGGVVLGGVLGGGLGAFIAKAELGKGMNDLGARLMNSSATETIDFPGGSSVGAAQVTNTTVKQESLVGSLGVGEALSFQSPMTRNLNVGVAAIQRDTLSLVESPFRFNKNDEGIATTDSRGAVETQVTLARAVAVEVEEQVQDIFVEMRTGKERGFGSLAKIQVSDKFGKPAAVTFPQFKEQVSEAFDLPGDHPDPYIARAVDTYSKMFTKIGKQAEELGLIPEGTVGNALENGGRYFPIDYHSEAIIARRPEWEKILSDNFVRRAGNHEAEFNAVAKEVEALKAQEAQVRESLPDDTLLNAARDGFTPELNMAKRPVADLLKTMGGIDPDSPFASELASIDVTPKTAPGLFRKGGRKEFDNIPFSENVLFRDNLAETPQGYVDPNEIIELIAQEVGGNPARTLEEMALIDEETGAIDSLIQFFDQNDIDIYNLSNDQIRDRLMRLDEQDLSDIRRTDAEGDTGGGETRSLADIEAESRAMGETGRTPAVKFGKAETEKLQTLEARMDTLRKLTDASDPLIARELAREVTESILGSSRTQLPESVISGPRGPLRERTLDIDPKLTRDFRNTDIFDIGRKYTRTSMVDMELVRKFGHTDMRSQFLKYGDEFEKLRHGAVTSAARKALKAGKLDHLDDAQKAAIQSGSFIKLQEIDDAQLIAETFQAPSVLKKMKKLDDQEKRVRADMTTMLRRVRGEMVTPRNPHSVWMKGQRAALSLNYMRLLGFQTVSAIPDLAIPLFKYGMRPFMAGWGQAIGNFRNFNLASKELKSMGVGIEMAWDGRLAALSENFVGESGSSKFEKGVDATARAYGIATLMTPWNALQKTIVGATVADFIQDSAAKQVAGKLKPKKAAELARMNINPEMAARIHQQMLKHSPNYKKDRVFNLDKWDDAAARDNVMQAVPAETDRIILTPKNTKPTWMSTPQGQLVGQFKSFGFDSAQAILVAGLQKKDAETLMGMVTMMFLGGLVYQIKENAAGREVPSFEEDPGKWFTEAFDRSGMAGWLMDANNVTEKLTRGKVGLSALTNSGPASRYASRNVLGALLGPSAGLVDDLASVTGSASQGDWSEKDTARARRLIPFQNALGIRRVFDEFEEKTNIALGIDG